MTNSRTRKRLEFDALAALRAAGHPIDALGPAQREVFAGLNEAEVTLLNSIKDRLDAVAAEVEGHDMKIL